MKNQKVLVALGLSAAAALLFEVVATNILFFHFAESSFSIATVLFVFLLGLGIGSYIIHLIQNKISNTTLWFALSQIIIGLFGILVLSNIINISAKISSFGLFLVSFVLLIIPTIFLGATFTLAGLIYQSKKNSIGLIYSADLLGAILGTLVAGFLLIPYWGNKITILFGASLSLLSAALMFKKYWKILPIVIIILAICIGYHFTGTQQPNVQGPVINLDKDSFYFYAPSPFGEVKIENGELYIENRDQCSIHYDKDASERWMANVALENVDAKKVLNIGLGCGLTATRVINISDADLTIVEINPTVVLANQGISDIQFHPRVNLIIDDGLNFLSHSKTKYDAILIDIENPDVAHASPLYTLEAFQLVNNSLSEQGVFSLWTYGHVNEEMLDIIYYTLKDVFEFVYQYGGGSVLLASNHKLDTEEYHPRIEYKINTLDKNTLSEAYIH